MKSKQEVENRIFTCKISIKNALSNNYKDLAKSYDNEKNILEWVLSDD